MNATPSLFHMVFQNLHDREISGFLTAAIAWGRRDLILRSSRLMLELMDKCAL